MTSSSSAKHPVPLKEYWDSYPYTTNHWYGFKELRRLGSATNLKFVGPMPPEKFLQEFLPIPDEKVFDRPWKWGPELEKQFEDICNLPREKDMYEPLIKALKIACGNKLCLVNTSEHADPLTEGLLAGGLKPDISAYEPGYEEFTTNVTDFSLMEFHLELKKSPQDRAFLDTGVECYELDHEYGEDTRGQIAGYITTQFTCQFRTHAFSALINENVARVIRWDRSGAIVSRRFDYTKTDWLLEFIWRYSHASTGQRGRDMSVQNATPEELTEASAGLGFQPTKPLLKFSITDDITNTTSYFLGCNPGSQGHFFPFGRATRIIPVWDLQRKRCSILKDTWRVDLPDFEKEGSIYESLHAANVPHISKITCAGDVRDTTAGSDNHKTRTHMYYNSTWVDLREPWDKPDVRPHSHYRIIFEEIGLELTSFTSSKQLVTVARDALVALVAAYQKAKILHQDISSGNILITSEGRGLLIDWDHARRINTETGVVPPAERVGTWPFISIRLLKTTEHLAHSLADDIESLLHVLNWVALRFMPHQLTPAHLKYVLDEVVNYRRRLQDGWVGGCGKEHFLLSGTENIGTIGLNNRILVALLKDLAYTFVIEHVYPPSAAASEKLEEYDRIGEACGSSRKDCGLIFLAMLYNERKAHMEDPGWAVKRFEDALLDGPWPENDASAENKVLENSCEDHQRKRGSDDSDC
ncbi:hypothetical protein Hypma_009358 [Hypsizygus marmoreus]|uniref:Fungal-type protein kinase domain-containing protein n=1 Tax=Hypsizygus marmoreus TaxID=39966 RepID=A0A369JSU5_HYPMA|nr:hypothetical protein Hypma_009358 [Hypsizygus marmoreus]